MAGQQCSRSHDLSRLTVAALGDLFGEPRFDHAISRLGCQAFNRDEAFAGHLGDGGHASTHGFAVGVNRADAANPDTAFYFVPLSPRVSRNAHSSGISAGAST